MIYENYFKKVIRESGTVIPKIDNLSSNHGQPLLDSTSFLVFRSNIKTAIDMYKKDAQVIGNSEYFVNNIFSPDSNSNYNKIIESKNLEELHRNLKNYAANLESLIGNHKIRENPYTLNPIKALFYAVKWLVRTIASKLGKEQPTWTYSRQQNFLTSYCNNVRELADEINPQQEAGSLSAANINPK